MPKPAGSRNRRVVPTIFWPMLLDGRSLWLAQTNAWVLAPGPGGPAVVIDAPPDIQELELVLKRHELQAAALILTHGHVDHMGGAEDLRRSTGAACYVHPSDDFLTLDPGAQLRALFGSLAPGPLEAPSDRIALHDGMVIDLAGLALEVRHTPGHTPGHCCLYLRSEGWLFSGDQLFAGSIGRTDLPGGDFDALMRSMREKVLDLPDDTRVLPGHGPETTIGRERATNPFLYSV